MRRSAILAVACLGLPSIHAETAPENPTARGGFDPSPFPHLRETVSPIPEAGLFRIEIDPGLHRHGGRRLDSARLVKTDGERLVDVPCVVLPAQVPKPGRPSDRLRHLVESFEERPDGAIEITASLPADSKAPARLEIETPLRDFEKGVVVSVPSPEGEWIELVGDAVIFDHSRFLDFRHTAVSLPETPARRFRLRIADATDEQRSLVREITRTVGDASGQTLTESAKVETRAFRIDELRFLSAPEKATRSETGRRVEEIAILESATDEKGVSTFLLDTGNLPLDRLALSTGDRNFRRAVSVQVPQGTGDDAWRTVHRHHVHRYEVGDFRDESLAIPLAEMEAERCRLLVENGDNPPLDIQGVVGRGPVYEILFLAEAGDRPVLYLGAKAEAVEASDLDTAALEAAIQRKVPAEAVTLGELVGNPGFVPAARTAAEGGLLNSKPALWGVIALAVAVLVWVLYRSLLRIEEAKIEDG